MKKLERRTFIKEGCQLGLSAMLAEKALWGLPRIGIMGQEGRDDGPICKVKKEVRVSCPELGLAPIINMQYIGTGMVREETLSFMQSSDWKLMEMKRNSQDNGRSWTPWKPLVRETQKSGQFIMSGGASQNGTGPLDPASGMLIKPVFQRIFEGDPTVALSKLWQGERLFWDHGFIQLSEVRKMANYIGWEIYRKSRPKGIIRGIPYISWRSMKRNLRLSKIPSPLSIPEIRRWIPKKFKCPILHCLKTGKPWMWKST